MSNIKSPYTKKRNNMASVSQRLEDTMERISQYREEQESKLLTAFAIAPSSSSLSLINPKTVIKRSGYNTTDKNSNIFQSKMILNNKNSKDCVDFFDLIEKNILVLANAIMNSSCWPLALATVSNDYHDKKSEKYADLGTLDSPGSVWKMILRPDAYPGTRILLQTNEIGETPSYLRADLTFHESVEMAAVWTVYTVTNINATSQPEHTSSGGDDGDGLKYPHEGVIVRFELFEGPSGSYGTRSEGRYLVSVVSKNLSQGIALMTDSEMRQDSKDGELSFGMQWELIPEDLEISDPDIDFVFAD